jgi:hypothetical protein
MPLSRACRSIIKIALKSEASLVFEMLRPPLSVLLHPSVIAYQESTNEIYLADPYAELTFSRLTEAVMPLEVVKFQR